MTPQLVDLNADGYQDMVMGTFEGTAFLVEGTKEGFKEPTQILDKNGEIWEILQNQPNFSVEITFCGLLLVFFSHESYQLRSHHTTRN